MNSPEKCFILIIFFRLLIQVEPYPSNKNPYQNDEASRKIIVGTNRRGNPEERGPYFEGDIIRSRFKQLRKSPNLWSNGTVPYQISGTFSK